LWRRTAQRDERSLQRWLLLSEGQGDATDRLGHQRNRGDDRHPKSGHAGALPCPEPEITVHRLAGERLVELQIDGNLGLVKVAQPLRSASTDRRQEHSATSVFARRLRL